MYIWTEQSKVSDGFQKYVYDSGISTLTGTSSFRVAEKLQLHGSAFSHDPRTSAFPFLLSPSGDTYDFLKPIWHRSSKISRPWFLPTELTADWRKGVRKEKGSKVSLRAKDGKIPKKWPEKVEAAAQLCPSALLHPSPQFLF